MIRPPTLPRVPNPKTLMLHTLICLAVAGCGGGGSDAVTSGQEVAVQATSATLDSTPLTGAPLDSGLVATAVSDAAPATPFTDVDSQDVIARAVPAQDFKQLGWAWSVECAGQALGGLNVPESGLRGTDLGDGWADLRFGRVTAADRAVRAYILRLDQSDLSIRGGQRCEMSASPTQGGALPVGQTIWYAVALQLPNWVPAADESIITQFHSSAGNTPLNPFVALSVRGNRLHLAVRHNANATPAKETTTVVGYDLPGGLPINRWFHVVVNARISPTPEDRPFLKLWLDGSLMVDHRGPVGYANVDTQYLKLGLYHWNGTANAWQPQAPTRTVFAINPALVRDLRERYMEPDIRRYVGATR